MISEAQAQTYYKTLGVRENATAQQISAAFDNLDSWLKRELGKYHPDKRPGDKAAEEKTKELNIQRAQIKEANDVLSDDNRRAAYDTTLKSERIKGQRPPEGPGQEIVEATAAPAQSAPQPRSSVPVTHRPAGPVDAYVPPQPHRAAPPPQTKKPEPVFDDNPHFDIPPPRAASAPPPPPPPREPPRQAQQASPPPFGPGVPPPPVQNPQQPIRHHFDAPPPPPKQGASAPGKPGFTLPSHAISGAVGLGSVVAAGLDGAYEKIITVPSVMTSYNFAPAIEAGIVFGAASLATKWAIDLVTKPKRTRRFFAGLAVAAGVAWVAPMIPGNSYPVIGYVPHDTQFQKAIERWSGDVTNVARGVFGDHAPYSPPPVQTSLASPSPQAKSSLLRLG